MSENVTVTLPYKEYESLKSLAHTNLRITQILSGKIQSLIGVDSRTNRYLVVGKPEINVLDTLVDIMNEAHNEIYGNKDPYHKARNK